MWTFQVPFWVFMLIMPLPCVLLYRNRALGKLESEDREAVARESRPGIVRLAVISAAVLVGFVVWFVLDSAAIASGARRDAFWWVLFGAFFFLWWLFAMPVIRKINQAPEQRGMVHHGVPTGPVRVASLRPRRIADYLPRTARVLPPVLAVAALVAFVVHALAYPPQELRFLWGAILFGAFALLELILYAFWIRREVAESYPLVGDGRAVHEFEEEVERLRHFRVWSVYWLGLVMAAVSLGAATLFIEVGRGALNEAAGDLIGGIAGTAAGCCGAAFGFIASLYAIRLGVLRSKIASSSGDLCPGEDRSE